MRPTASSSQRRTRPAPRSTSAYRLACWSRSTHWPCWTTDQARRRDHAPPADCKQGCDNVVMVEGLWWGEADAEYIRTRSDRYPGATDIEPSWTQEAANDPRRIVRDPDPKSR